MDRIEPRIHDEIKDYKEKFYNFTIRQWLFAILILIIVVPLYLYLSPILGSDITGWLVILVAGPIGFIGFIPIQGLSAEKMIFFWKRNYINFSKPICYRTENPNISTKQSKLKMSKLDKQNAQKLAKEDKKKQKELKKERQRQRDLARAKKKFGEDTRKQVNNKDFSLSEEEAQVLLKFARQVIGKENNTVEEKTEESDKKQETQEKTDNS